MNSMNTIAIWLCIINALCSTWCYSMPKENPVATAVKITVPHVQRIHVIMDLGGVCFETHGKAVAYQLGLFNLLRGIGSGVPPREVKKTLYRVLHTIKPISVDAMIHASKDPDGEIMPLLMHDWMTGTPNEEILTTIQEAIKLNPHWFANKAERVLVLRLAKAMFTPEKFVSSRYLVPQADEFVTHCKHQGFRISVLSNWDKESFKYLFERYYHFFQKFDSIAISGETETLKPSPDAYAPFLEAYPHDCFIFIDDQIENIRTAQKMGMHTIHVPSKKTSLGTGTPDFTDVYHELTAITTSLNEMYGVAHEAQRRHHQAG